VCIEVFRELPFDGAVEICLLILEDVLTIAMFRRLKGIPWKRWQNKNLQTPRKCIAAKPFRTNDLYPNSQRGTIPPSRPPSVSLPFAFSLLRESETDNAGWREMQSLCRLMDWVRVCIFDHCCLGRVRNSACLHLKNSLLSFLLLQVCYPMSSA
jgi:hypothetical protein